jgi:putative ABC transport system substrate-binding protein
MRLSAIGLMLTFAILVAPRLAHAQLRGRVPRIGVLASTSPAERGAYLDGFWHGLHEMGWVEGQSIAVEWRWAEGNLERLPELAADLVRLKVDIIVTAGGTPHPVSRPSTRQQPFPSSRARAILCAWDSSPAWPGQAATSRV